MQDNSTYMYTTGDGKELYGIKGGGKLQRYVTRLSLQFYCFFLLFKF